MATRKRADSWVVTDNLWERVEPLIPVRERLTSKEYMRKPGAGRPPKPARQVFEAVVYVLRTGCQWKALPKDRFGSASAIHKRFLEWEAAGVFESIWQAGLAEYDQMEGISHGFGLQCAMNRRNFAGLAAGGLVGLPLGGRAQQKGKPWRIGFLNNSPRPSDGRVPAALRDAMQALGYVEGKHVVYEGRWAGLRRGLLLSLAAELVSLKLDLVVAMGEGPAEAVQKASSTMPIIAVNAGDLVEIGLVTSLARPGGNLTGINDQSIVLSGKRLELLKEAVPVATRIAVLWNADLRGMTLRYREIEKAAQLLRISIEPLGVREPDDFADALAAMDRTPPDALMLVTDALTNLNRQRVIDYALAHRIPTMYEFGSLVQGGGLMSYGGDIGENYKLAASYIVKIFKGAKPGDLPVEQPNRYFLFINMRTAQSLGLKIPQSLLLRADQVVE